MKLKHKDTILLVENIEISKRFYSQTLGLEILHDGGSMVVFDERLAILQATELLPREETEKFLQPGLFGRGNVVIYLQCDDLDGCHQKLKDEGVEIIHGILTMPWERLFRIYDPDRYVVEIGEAH
jgi:predicted enzyme related to lactoylglutathione lyase